MQPVARDVAQSVGLCMSVYVLDTTVSLAKLNESIESRFGGILVWWLGSRVVSVLNSGAEGPGYKSQSRRCQVTILGKLLTPIVPLFTKQQNW